ncbi:MAG: response regulator transcription factor [Thermoleophilia bacterium]
MLILVIEDDPTLADLLMRGLRDAGHDVVVHGDGREGLEAAAAGAFDAVVLDWMLPGMDGPSVCRELRLRGRDTPVLMLTARAAVPDRVAGLDAGADDYLAKPFALDELLARLRVFARRGGGGGRLVLGDLVVDRDARTVARAGAPIVLTAREFDLLVALVARPGRVVSRDRILDEVWDGETDLRSNAIDVHVANLRAKIDRPFGTETIRTVRGVGFVARAGGE